MHTFFQLVDAMGARTTLAIAEYEQRVPAATRAVVAVAGHVQRDAPKPTDAAALATARLVPSAIARTFASLYETDAPPPVDFDHTPADAPLPLGVQSRDDGARDVFWIRRPEASTVKAFLAERERGARATTLLVPTTRGLPDDWATRWNATHVEIHILAEHVVVRGGAIALAPRLRVLRVAAGRPSPDIPLATPVPSATVDRGSDRRT